VKENLTNFATTSLVSPNPLTAAGTSFTVTTNQGALFPTSNFLVTIDSEILLITSRSGDTFTVGARGYDGSTAASHTAGATVQESITAQIINHLWQNTADTFHADVPPIQQPGGLTPSIWDNEFEKLGNWTLYPASPSGSTVWNVSTSLRSHLVLDRSNSDNSIYTAYIAFNPPASTEFMVTAKVAEAMNFVANPNSTNQVSTWLQVTDQTNPTASVGSGNRFQGKLTMENATQSSGASNAIDSVMAQAYMYQAVTHAFVSGSSLVVAPMIILPPFIPLYLRIYYNGNGTYTFLIGNGFTFWPLGQYGGMTFTPQSIAIQFLSTALACTHAVDFIRVAVGNVNPNIGY
jgi:hypothetical protein